MSHGNRFVNFIVGCPCLSAFLVMFISILTIVGTWQALPPKPEEIFASENANDLNDIRTMQWDAFKEAQDIAKSFRGQGDDDCVVERAGIERKCDTKVYPQQTQNGDIVLMVFIDKEGNNLFTEDNLKQIKTVEDTILNQAQFPEYCLRWDEAGLDNSCQQPLSPLGLFYANYGQMAVNFSNAMIFDQVDGLDGSRDGNLDIFNNRDLNTHLSLIYGEYNKQMRQIMSGNTHECAINGVGSVEQLVIASVQVCLLQMATSQSTSASARGLYTAMFPLLVALRQPRGEQIQDVEKTLKLAAGMQRLGVYSPFVDYFFDNDFSAANPRSAHSRAIIEFGLPLKGYRNRDDRDDDQEEHFSKWFRDEFNTYLKDTKDVGSVEVLFFATPLLRDEFLSLIIGDCLRCLISLGLVFIWIWIQTNSIIIAIAGASEIILSIPLAFVFYYIIFGFKYFDGLNAMTLFIVAAIGADDIFVFMDQYKQSSYHPEVCKDLKTRMNWVYARASWAMLITSVTTCAAFICTAVSPLASIQSFGIFSAFVIMADYVLVITWFPCCVVLYHNYLENRPCCPCCCFGAGKDQACDIRCRVKELWPCTRRMQTSTSLVSARGATEKPTKRMMERFLSGPVAGCLGNRIGAMVVVGIFLALLIPSSILGSGIEEISRSEQFLPSDHPFQRIWDYSSEKFPDSAQNTNTPAFVIWGVHGIDNDKVNPLRDGQLNKGTVLWDHTFRFDEDAQKHIWNVCEEVRHLSAAPNLEEFLSRDTDSPNNYGEVVCPLDDWKAFLELPGGPGFPLPLSNVSTVMGDFLAWTSKNSFGQDESMEDKWRDLFGYDPYHEGGSVRMVVVEVTTRLVQRASHPGEKLRKNYDLFEEWVEEINSPVGRLPAPPTANKAFQTCDGSWDGPMWIWMHTQQLFRQSAIQGSITGTILAFVVILLATQQIIIAFAAFFTIASILITVLAMMNLAGYELGTITSVCITILAGFAVDYVVHLAHAYNHSTAASRAEKFQETFDVIGVSVLSGMVTSVLAASVLLTCSLQYFAKFGFFLIFTVSWAWIWGNFFFMCVMRLVGPDPNTPWFLQLPYSILPARAQACISASGPEPMDDIANEENAKEEGKIKVRAKEESAEDDKSKGSDADTIPNVPNDSNAAAAG